MTKTWVTHSNSHLACVKIQGTQIPPEVHRWESFGCFNNHIQVDRADASDLYAYHNYFVTVWVRHIKNAWITPVTSYPAQVHVIYTCKNGPPGPVERSRQGRKILGCALNCARLCFELCQTAPWTVPDCTLKCARLCFEMCQTALWTVPDCALKCARQQRFHRLTVTGSGVQTDGATKLNKLSPTDFTLHLEILKSFSPEDQRACDWYVQNAAER